MSAMLRVKGKSKAYLSALETYAKRGDGRKFQETAERIPWEAHSPIFLRRAIDLALSLELSRLAMDLAQKGSALFPSNKEIQIAAKILKPPTVRVLKRPPSSLASSMEWVKTYAGEYNNQWVAVRDGELLASAQSFNELAATTTLDADTLVTKVL